MPTFLSDPPTVVYFVLFGAVIVLGAVYASKQDRRSLIPLAVAIVLVLLVVLIDRFMESSREEAVRRAEAMAKAADDKNPAGFVEHMADSVEFSGGQQPRKVTRDEIRNWGLWGLLRQYDAHIAVWDFSRADVKPIDDKTIEIGFMAKGEPKNGAPYMLYVRATFTRQPDGTMKVTKVATFHPTNHAEPLTVPNFP